MIRRAWFCLFLLFLPWISKSEISPSRYLSKSTVPTWCKPYNVSEISSGDLASVANGCYYILVENQSHAERKEFYHHIAYKITNTSGLESSSEISVNFDPSYQKVSFHSIKVTRNGQTSNRLAINNFKLIQREADMEMHLYDGSLNALLILDDIRIGDQIEYDYTVYGSNPIYEGKFQHWFSLQFTDPTKILRTKYYFSSTHPLYHKVMGKAPASFPEAIEGKEENLQTLEWSWENVPALMQEGNVPEWYFTHPFLLVSSFANWNEVASWSERVFSSTNTQLPPDFVSRINKWKKSKNGIGSAVDSLLVFVKDSIRYTGIEMGENAIKPTAPSLVLKRRFGDCKDKSLLLVTGLRNLGLESYPVMTSSYIKYSYPDWLPTPSAFNHCIAYVKVQNKEYWFDPTITGQGGSFDKMYCPEYKWGLLIDSKQKGLTKMEGANPSSIKVEEDFHVSSFYEKAILKVRTEYEGVEADGQREYFKGNWEAIKKSYVDFYTRQHPSIAITHLRVDDNFQNNVFTVFEEYEIDSLWKEDTLPAGQLRAKFFPQIIGQQFLATVTANRKTPYRLSHPVNITQVVTVFLPEDWTSNDAPITINNAFCTFSQSINNQGRTVTMKYAYTSKTDMLEAKDYKKFAEQQERIYNNLGYDLTYNMYDHHDTTTATSGHTNWLLVVVAGLLAFLVYLLCKYIYKYDPEPLISNPENWPVGGVLILLAIALAISPFRLAYDIYQNNYFDLSIWNAWMNPENATYNPIMGLIIVIELFYNLFIFGFFLLLNYLFHKRRTSFRMLYTLYFPVHFVMCLVLEIVANSFNGTSDYFQEYKTYIQLAVAGAIWITYMHNSKRVNHTFGERLEDNA